MTLFYDTELTRTTSTDVNTGIRRAEEKSDTWRGYDITLEISDKSRLSLFYGPQKGGLVCANGVCAVQPDLNDGVKFTFRTLF